MCWGRGRDGGESCRLDNARRRTGIERLISPKTCLQHAAWARFISQLAGIKSTHWGNKIGRARTLQSEGRQQR